MAGVMKVFQLGPARARAKIFPAVLRYFSAGLVALGGRRHHSVHRTHRRRARHPRPAHARRAHRARLRPGRCHLRPSPARRALQLQRSRHPAPRSAALCSLVPARRRPLFVRLYFADETGQNESQLPLRQRASTAKTPRSAPPLPGPDPANCLSPDCGSDRAGPAADRSVWFSARFGFPGWPCRAVGLRL